MFRLHDANDREAVFAMTSRREVFRGFFAFRGSLGCTAGGCEVPPPPRTPGR